jgi:hypothetical protein
MVKGRRIDLAAAALLLALVSSTCGRKETESPFRRAVDRPVTLEVDNNNFLDVTVYAVAGGYSLRLGNVGGKNVEEFTLDSQDITIAGGLQFLVDPIGATQTYLSPKVFPYGGATVELNVSAFLNQSFVSIR